MRLAVAVLLSLSGSCALAQSSGYVFEGVCIPDRGSLAKAMCGTGYPVVQADKVTSCVGTEPDGRLTLEILPIPWAPPTYTQVYASAPACTRASIALESIRWGNAAHVGQALIAVLVAALFVHGYSTGARE